MKKLLCAMLMICSLSPLYAQVNNIVEYNKVVWCAIGYNVAGYTHEGKGGFSAVVNCCGVHIDYGENIEGSQEANMGVGIYDGYKTSAFHIGYSLPVTECFKVTPVFGVSNWAKGYYDGLDYIIDDDAYIHNKFYPTYEYSRFDYGLILSYEIERAAVVYLNIERDNIGIGVGISFRTAEWQ